MYQNIVLNDLLEIVEIMKLFSYSSKSGRIKILKGLGSNFAARIKIIGINNILQQTIKKNKFVFVLIPFSKRLAICIFIQQILFILKIPQVDKIQLL